MSTSLSAPRRLPLAHLMWRNRYRQDLTLDAMADRTGLSKSTLWQMENGVQRNPKHATLLAICNAYGFPISAVSPPRLQRRSK